jgi:probable rRNA maturation factor
LPIFFHSIDVSFNLKDKKRFRKWISDEIKINSLKVGQVNIIFCSDDYLLVINRKYLNHDFYTDIITFNYNDRKTISADLYISIERVKENSVNFNTEFITELKRVIIHGILHLLGNEDHLPELKNIIHNKEDEALKRFP